MNEGQTKADNKNDEWDWMFACCPKCRTSFADGGLANTDFYHYVLGQLAASDAHLNKKSGKALCEIFGAFGWGENVCMMKWLIRVDEK